MEGAAVEDHHVRGDLVEAQDLAAVLGGEGAGVGFAGELVAGPGLKLGDALVVNVLGRDIPATITSFRQVDFSSAGMGFVMTLNPSALQGAPHTFIATVYAVNYQ